MPRAAQSALLVLLAVACTDRPSAGTAPEEMRIPVVAERMGGDPSASDDRFHAQQLLGEKEAPVPRVTDAQGNAVFRLSKDGESIDYSLVVSDISNVRQSHIHLGTPDVAGPIVVFLYGPVPAGGGPIQGQIASGTFTAANFVGPLAGHPMADLLVHLRDGTAYVNVHTDDGIAPANTGPGDFPGGEIRSTIYTPGEGHE